MTTKQERRKQAVQFGKLTPKGWTPMEPVEFSEAERQRRRQRNRIAKASRKANRPK